MTNHMHDATKMVSPAKLVQRYHFGANEHGASMVPHHLGYWCCYNDLESIVSMAVYYSSKWDESDKRAKELEALNKQLADDLQISRASALQERMELQNKEELANRKWVAEYWAGEVLRKKIADLEHTIEAMKPYLREDPEGL